MRICVVFGLLVLLQGQFTSRAGEMQSARERFVAHEWGTFTSVQGADGIQLEWNPFVKEELPKFVYERNRALGYNLPGSKGAFVTLQRMETPVIYFYSDRARTVDVTVKFPQGIVTEWYPQIAKPKQPTPLFWDDVRIIPPRPYALLNCSSPGTEDPLPTELSGSHYYAARDAEADLLQVKLPEGKVEHEKFLFYRGVGNFTAPLRVTTTADATQLHLQNGGTEALTHLYVLYIKKGTAKYVYLDKVARGESRTVALEPGQSRAPLSDVQTQIGDAMKKSLESQGLYGHEAAAMVKTWRDSWFGEEGLRILYVLSRTWTDRTLPLTIEPQPEEITRVMVGRAEVIAPEVEWKILKQIVRFSEPDEDAKLKAVAEMKDLGIGRFADAIVRRTLGKTASVEFSRAAWGLLDRLNAANQSRTLAAR